MSGVPLVASRRADRIAWTAAAIVPSLAAATTLSAALWLSAVVLAASLAAALLAALLVRRPALACVAVLVLLAALVGAADRAAAAWMPGLYASLGIYLPVSIILLPSAAAAAALRDDRREGGPGRAVKGALAGTLAFLGVTAFLSFVREALGAGTVTLPGLPVERTIVLPGISTAPARALLLPFMGLVLAGYLAGLAVRVAQIVQRGKARRAAAAPAAAAPVATAAPAPASAAAAAPAGSGPGSRSAEGGAS